MRRILSALTCIFAFAGATSAQDFDEVQISTTRITESISMLQGSGGNIDAGRSADEIVTANPTEGYAEPGPGTERWIRAAVDDLSRW